MIYEEVLCKTINSVRSKFLLENGEKILYGYYSLPLGAKWIVKYKGQYYHIIHDGTDKGRCNSHAPQKITEEEAKRILSKDEVKWAEAVCLWRWEFLDRYLEKQVEEKKYTKTDSRNDSKAQVLQKEKEKMGKEKEKNRQNKETKIAYEIYKKTKEKMTKIKELLTQQDKLLNQQDELLTQQDKLLNQQDELLTQQDKLIYDLLKLVSYYGAISKEEFAKRIEEIRDKYALSKSSKINQKEKRK